MQIYRTAHASEKAGVPQNKQTHRDVKPIMSGLLYLNHLFALTPDVCIRYPFIAIVMLSGLFYVKLLMY